jgi:quinoprotein glucose dehydrogenase
MKSSLRHRFALFLWPLLIAIPLARPASAAVEPLFGGRVVGTNQLDGQAVSNVLRRFTVPRGFKVDLWAAEPDVQNPVSICFDEHGRLYVVESHRRRSSVFDIRNHKDWLETDFSLRTVEDRANYYKWAAFPVDKTAIPQPHPAPRNGLADFNGDGVIDWRDLEVESERIRILEDTDGSGRAGRVTTFADGFNTLVSGVAAGILVRHDEVYFTCIPDLWKLHAPEGGGPSDRRVKLLGGFGAHIAFGGHDMHGLIFGPDGRLYWSIADRGTSTNLLSQMKNPFPGLTPETLADAGAVFRCNPDGSEFEIFATGLRNPQELAFDDEGNLFTGDNNGDGGDPARWHYVVEGADHGWRMGWQWLPKMGAWNSERLWANAPTNHAAYIVPSLAHIARGPAGLAFNPGTGLPPEYDGHFFLCDFPADVLTWTNRVKGAYFETGPVTHFFGKLGPSDITFGVEGGVYVSDWTPTFEKTGKGRIYHVYDPATDQSAIVQETKRLLARGTTGLGSERLAELLSHPDRRIRMEAQFELAARARSALLAGSSETAALKLAREIAAIARSNTNRLARLHAVWAFDQVCRAQPALAILPEELRSLRSDGEAEIRAQYAKFLGERPTEPPGLLVSLMQDANPRVRFFAAQSLGELGRKEAGPALLGLLRSNNDEDPFLRHAAVLALARLHDLPALLQSADDPSPAVRLGVLLVLRRWQRPEVTRFLKDAEPGIILEAARAINDAPIPAGLPALAKMLEAASADSAPGARASSHRALVNPDSEPGVFTLRRALNANFRLGSAENAKAVAAFAARSGAPDSLRIEALEMLADWSEPPRRDKIVGLSRPLPRREARIAAEALRPMVPTLLHAEGKEIRIAFLRAAAALGLAGVDFFSILSNPEEASEVRIEALKSLAEGKDARLAEAVRVARADPNARLRAEATRLQGKSPGDLAALASTLKNGSAVEKQSAIGAVSELAGPSADGLILEQLESLLGGGLPQELALDTLEAAGKRNSPAIKAKLSEYEARLAKEDALAPYRPALYGGNAEQGRKTFFERQDAGCFRCHKINGEGGAVGPDLTGLGRRQPREYILESIVFPNKQIAPGFENAIVTLKNGVSYAGLVKSATDMELVLNTGEDGEVKIQVAAIQSRQRGTSAMPEGLAALLSREDLRNLVEFLAASK